MATKKATNGSSAPGVDAVFAGVPKSPTAPAPRRTDPGRVAPPEAAEALLAPFPLGEQADLRAERKWLEEERKGLEAYLLHQFAAIREEREKLLAQEAKINETLALRQHKMKRQTALLMARVD